MCINRPCGRGGAAQPFAFNAAGVTNGHWHLNSKDVAANEKIFVAMGGKAFQAGGRHRVLFPGVMVILDTAPGAPPPSGPSRGRWSPETTAASIRPTSTRRTACAAKFWKNKNQSAPIQSEHVHLFLPEAAIPQSQAWYGKFSVPRRVTANNAPVADIPGVQLRFAKAESAQAPAKGRILGHIGFDVKDLKAFIKTLEANNIKLDRPYTVNDSGVGIAFITDP